VHSQTLSMAFHEVKVVKQVEILSSENISSLLISFYCVKMDNCLIEGCRLLSWEMNDSTYLALLSKSRASMPSIRRENLS
jgi:hypothetical protein